MRSLSLLVGAGLVSAHSLSEQWSEFKQIHNKVYSSVKEEMQRFEIFAENAAKVAKMNALGGGATFSHKSPLADWSTEEFNKRNALRMTRGDIEAHAEKADRDSLRYGLESAAQKDLPDTFDWREKGATNEVKDQGQCGSCWAFSTVANIEGNNFVRNKELVSLSEQEIVDCDKVDQGCNGGLPVNAFQVMLNRHMGLERESDYTYHARDGQCKMDKSKEIVFLSSFVNIKRNEDKMAELMMQYGPLSVALNAEGLQMYSEGIYDPWFCNPLMLDHAVTLVGWGSDDNGPEWFGPTKYWTVRNSWGSSWGEKGHFRIARGKGKCGINSAVSSGIVRTKDSKFLQANEFQFEF